MPSCTRAACRAHTGTCTCVTVRDRQARELHEHCCLRAPRPGVLDLEAARNYLPTWREQPGHTVLHTVVHSTRGQLCVGAAALRCLPGPVALRVQRRRTCLGYIREDGTDVMYYNACDVIHGMSSRIQFFKLLNFGTNWVPGSRFGS